MWKRQNPLREEAKAKRLYETLFGEPMPDGWRIYFHKAGATCDASREIFVLASEMEDAVDTLIHEFVHQRHPEWKHGKRFFAEVRRLTAKVLRY